MERDIGDLRKKLLFRSWHRGTREMDLLLGTFAEKNLDGFSREDLESYERILEISDPDLYNWMTGVEPPPAEAQGEIFDKILKHRFI